MNTHAYQLISGALALCAVLAFGAPQTASAEYL